jgi:ubiquitin C-terminal hydrolase
VGLVNLGCICYMNAMLQQLFMTREFKYPLLSVDFTSRHIPIMEKKGRKYKDNVLLQLQRMFGYLQMSERADYSPEMFCYSFKNDINFGIQ